MSVSDLVKDIQFPSRVRVRVKVERFILAPDERTYWQETQKETLLETCADPTTGNLEMIRKQVEGCLTGYKPEKIL